MTPALNNPIARESDVFEQYLDLNHKHILELGCGKARVTRIIANTGEGRTVTATEVDQIQHEKNLTIDDLPNVTFLAAGAQDIPAEDESVDVVFMFKSLHHVPLDVLDQALKEVKRVLKPSGFAYISEPIFEGDFNEIMRLFHNEQVVRLAAYEAVKRSVSNGDFCMAEELFFSLPRHYESFADFDKKMLQVTHTEHRLSDDLYQQVKAKFENHLGENGAQFQVPIRVNLLQKC